MCEARQRAASGSDSRIDYTTVGQTTRAAARME
jgi:hypothetical protein